MNITPSQSTLQAFGSSLNSTTPSAQVRQPITADSTERPTPNLAQRADAAPRAEAPARPDADSRPPVQEGTQRDRPGSRLNLVV